MTQALVCQLQSVESPELISIVVGVFQVLLCQLGFLSSIVSYACLHFQPVAVVARENS